MALPKRNKTITLTFKRDALIYDISNYAYVEGDIMPTDDPAKHQVLDIVQEGNVDRVTRMLDIAHAECVEMMYPYSKMECSEVEQRDNELKETDVYAITLLVPDGFSQTTTTLISKLAHEYMVCRVLFDWFSITKPAAQNNWGIKMENARAEIRERLNARCNRIRRTQSPF